MLRIYQRTCMILAKMQATRLASSLYVSLVFRLQRVRISFPNLRKVKNGGSLKTPNVPVQGRGAALSRSVPCNAGLALSRKETDRSID
jgi:hypothetical protein